jgi:hydroxymethylglutaryl-CoA lyase
MSNSDQVLEGLLKLQKQQKQKQDVIYSVLVPNMKGLEIALQDPINQMVDEIAIFTAASEEFSKRNINTTIDESMERFRTLVNHLQQYQLTKTEKIQIRGYVSTVIECPYQGPVKPTQVAAVVERMLDLGCYEVSLGDTIGVGTPGTIRKMLEEVLVRCETVVPTLWSLVIIFSHTVSISFIILSFTNTTFFFLECCKTVTTCYALSRYVRTSLGKYSGRT